MSEENNEQNPENENNEENAENKPEEENTINLVKEERVEKEGEETGEAKEEPTNEVVAESGEEPKTEIVEEKKEEEQPKEEVQEEPKEETQEEPKEEAQEEQKLEIQEEPKEEPQEEPKEEAQEEQKIETQEEPKEEPQEEPKEETQEEPKEEPQEEPKEEPQEEPKEEPQEEPKEEPKEENEEEPKEEPQEEPQEEPKEENEEEPKEEPQEDSSEESKEEPKDEYKEVDIYTREEPKEEPKKLYDKQESKDEPKEEEADKDDKSDKSDSEQKEAEVPTEIILFSTLSKEDKIKYFNFFIANDTQFYHEPEGTWLAEIDIFEDDKPEENEEISSKQKDIKNLRQSAFRSTKKDYDTIYSKLINVINPPPGVKGKKMDINAIKYMIQEIYSLKFLKDTQDLFNKEDSEPEAFPVFVGNFLINKFPKKDILHKKAVDFMLSLDFYGLKHKEIKIFQQFVTEEYDAEDLIFYLFVRSCIEKELKVFFLEKAKENLGQGLLYGQEDDDIMVPVKKCDKLAKAIFGTEDKDLLKSFMSNIKKLVETDAADEKKKHLKANAILNMALQNYHDSRGKVDEADEDQENDSDGGKKKKKKDKDKKKKDKGKDKDKDKDKDKKKLKKKKEEEVKKEKKEVKKKKAPKRKVESSEDEKEENYGDSDENNEEEEEEERISRKQPTKLRAQKKGNLKSYNTTSKPKAGSATKQRTKTSTLTTASKPGKGPKVTNTIKVVTNKTATKPSTKANAPTKSITSSRINTSGNKNKSARKASKEPRQVRETRESKESREPREHKEPRGESKKKRVPTSSAGKRKQTSSVGRRPAPTLYPSDNYEQTQDFKKILSRNRIEKVKTESDKINCLLFIINDYFKLKEIDPYFKSILDSNPIFQSYASKINTHIKNTKEFTLKKLSGICKYVAAGDKVGYYNFMRVKDKNGKGNYENLKSTFNSLLKSGPLKHLNENDIKEYCKMILDIPELSIQTSKSLLKHCE